MDYKVVQNYVITPIVLGKGCFGVVYRGYMKNNKNQLLAVKTISLQSIKNEEIVRREIEILLKLNSPNIVKFYKPAKTKKHLYFFLEYCQQDLKSYVKEKGGKLSELEVIDILRQICNGFKAVHQKNIIHRDIKPANFLIHQGVVKISDFGFARTVDSVEELVFLTFLGSPLYMAPQILAKEKFSSKCDVWSLGVTIYQFLYGKPPYTASNPAQLLINIRTKDLVFHQNIRRSPQIKQLLSRMLAIEQQKRISWNQLFCDPVVCPPPPQHPLQSSDDSFLRSYASNSMYMNRNKVVIKLSNTPEASELAPDHHKEEKEKDGKEKEDFYSDVKSQEEQLSQYMKIEQIDELMRYKRNVSVFLNVQCNLFFTLTSDKLPEIVFYIGLYLLLNQQIHIHNQLSKQLQSAKPQIKVIQDTWIYYKKSAAHSRISKLVNSDLQHLDSYFGEVKQRVKKAIKSEFGVKNATKYRLHSFEQSVLNREEFSEEDYCSMMSMVIKEIESVKVGDKNLLVKLKISLRPFKYLNEKLDFGIFYQFENEELEKLKAQFQELH